MSVVRTVPTQVEKSICMPIPKGAIGWIVGKGGAKINDIRARSGATLTINQGDDAIASITVSGSAQAVKTAEQLLAQELQKYRQRVAQNWR